MAKGLSIISLLSIITTLILLIAACSDMGDEIGTPTAPEPENVLTYWTDVSLIFQQHCVSCHGGTSGLYLDSWGNVFSTGNHAPVVIAGDADNSLLYQVLVDESNIISQMPPGGSLDSEDIDTIEDWIDDGCRENPPPAN